MSEVRIVEVRSAEQLEQAFAIRRAVFAREQGVSEAMEFDRRDDEACHLLALRDGVKNANRHVAGLRLRKVERSVQSLEG